MISDFSNRGHSALRDRTCIAIDLTVTGVFDSSRLTQSLQIAPTRAWRKGELTPPRRVPHTVDGWLVSTGFFDPREHPYVAFEDRLAQFLDLIEALPQEIRRCVGESPEISVCVIAYMRDGTLPDVVVPRTLLNRLAAMPITQFWVDVYSTSAG